MAVDNEPVPFWNGEREDEFIAQWKSAVGFRDGEWGEIAGAGKLNGSSGIWVDENILAPLGAGRDDACITDCLDTYFSSADGAARVADTYQLFAEKAGLPMARLALHPSEDTIAEQGVRLHRGRLLRELSQAAPDIVVTLGNAALPRVASDRRPERWPGQARCRPELWQGADAVGRRSPHQVAAARASRRAERLQGGARALAAGQGDVA